MRPRKWYHMPVHVSYRWSKFKRSQSGTSSSVRELVGRNACCPPAPSGLVAECSCPWHNTVRGCRPGDCSRHHVQGQPRRSTCRWSRGAVGSSAAGESCRAGVVRRVMLKIENDRRSAVARMARCWSATSRVETDAIGLTIPAWAGWKRAKAVATGRVGAGRRCHRAA